MQNLHGYFLYIGLDINKYNQINSLANQSNKYSDDVKQLIQLINIYKKKIIDNILKTQILNPFAKNSQAAIWYLKKIDNFFMDEANIEKEDKVQIIINENTSKVKLK